MALNRQQLPQRIFDLHHCIAAERAKWKRAANAIAKTRIALRSERRRMPAGIERAPTGFSGGRGSRRKNDGADEGRRTLTEGRQASANASRLRRASPNIGRTLLFANGGRFDHKRAGAGQNRRHLQKISSQSAEDGSNRDLFNHNLVGPNRPGCQSSSDGQATQPGKFIGPGQSPHQPRSASLSARFEQLVSPTRASARQLKSTNSWRTFRAR